LVAADPIVRRFGEAALLVELGDTARVHALDAALRADPPPATVATVPGIETLLVEFDPLATEGDRLADLVLERGRRMATPAMEPGRHRSIPVNYGGEDGPDLDEIAGILGMTAEQVVAAHTGADLRVLIDGFAPGFAYLGDLPAALDVPRLATPRTRTPAGSVAVAGRMSGIYPADLPGGWRVIGRTSLTLFDPRRDPPAYLEPGDRVRFVSVEADELERRAGPAEDW
jgi:KipI family sensor histidine kinase inhibitor